MAWPKVNLFGHDFDLGDGLALASPAGLFGLGAKRLTDHVLNTQGNLQQGLNKLNTNIAQGSQQAMGSTNQYNAFSGPADVRAKIAADSRAADQARAFSSIGSTASQHAQAMADERKHLANLKSQFAERANPYTANYANNLFTKGALGSIQRNFTDQAQQQRDTLGARGLGMAGPNSGGVTKAFDALNYRKTQALGDAAAQADLRTQELGNQWETEKARALDAFEFNRAQGSIAAAEAALRGDRLSQLMPYEVAAAGLGNIGAQDAIDFNRQMQPGRLEALQRGNQREALLTQQLAGDVTDAQWDRDNPWLAGGRDVLTSLIPQAARVGGMYLAGGMPIFGAPGAPTQPQQPSYSGIPSYNTARNYGGYYG